jgi:hypothetical protein
MTFFPFGLSLSKPRWLARALATFAQTGRRCAGASGRPKARGVQRFVPGLIHVDSGEWAMQIEFRATGVSRPRAWLPATPPDRVRCRACALEGTSPVVSSTSVSRGLTRGLHGPRVFSRARPAAVEPPGGRPGKGVRQWRTWILPTLLIPRPPTGRLFRLRDRKSTRLNSSHIDRVKLSRMPSSA